MADFIQTTNTRSAVRDLTIPIADITTFDALVQDIIDTNPFGCTAYVEQGVTMDPVIRSKETYDVKFVYENLEADTIGDVSVKVASVTAFGTAAAHVMADDDLAAAIGGTQSRDTAKDTFSCRLKCHDPSGETYFVTLSRTRVRISSYADDAIRATVEAWADGKPELG
ncbi:hypothetical protein L1S32_02195 [Methanogenium sp. S4BF]|uniref:hypothetical protein n=1 Tax=Methanogenium sp. S4BF TaxID=1789226 RepID=UPI00241710C7|nr:hypothetical protein [Methanogenium sp. S4BF]WFN34952.1 hypothetical protein L1S32_02195 [Methanogenium sp. S4BF]